MDNLIVMAPDQQTALQHHDMMLALIEGLGWHINMEKSSLVLAQSKEFLGMTVDTSAELHFQVLLVKAHMLKHNIECLL
jgi:hypothetical protein